MVAFHALLRTRELCRVQASHFVRHGGAGPILLTLPDTKSGIRRGDWEAESVVLTDPVFIQYLLVLLPRILPGAHLWPKDTQSLQILFRELCTDARPPPLPWKPYSPVSVKDPIRLVHIFDERTRYSSSNVFANANFVTNARSLVCGGRRWDCSQFNSFLDTDLNSLTKRGLEASKTALMPENNETFIWPSQ